MRHINFDDLSTGYIVSLRSINGTSKCYIPVESFVTLYRVGNITQHDWTLPGKEIKQMLENLRCISCPDGWRALRFLAGWEEGSQYCSQASCLKVDRSFFTIRWCELVIRKCSTEICVHWSPITAVRIRSLSYPDLLCFGRGWVKRESWVSETKRDPRLLIQCRLETLNFHLNSCAPSFRSNMAVPPLRMTVRRGCLQILLRRKRSLWILTTRGGVG